MLIPVLASAEKIVHLSAEHPEAGGWVYMLKRDDTPVLCRAEDEPKCISNIVEIDNPSRSTLECEASIGYEGVNNEGLGRVVTPALMLPHQRRKVINDRAPPEFAVSSHQVTCRLRPPLDRSRLTPECKARIDSSSIDLAGLYPPASRRAAEEGPVILEFSLSRKEGPPQEVLVVGSSLFPRLDRAAVEALSHATGSTQCETGRFLFQIEFKLTD